MLVALSMIKQMLQRLSLGLPVSRFLWFPLYLMRRRRWRNLLLDLCLDLFLNG